ncbi:MAG TPA: choice-of-anchor tandem repeat GloVer-containing protein [Candidatus Tumulicola sp.]
MPNSASQPENIAVGSDGNLWFTELAGNRIGKITTAGKVTEFTNGLSPSSSPNGITAGPAGTLWFTQSASYPNGIKLGTITTHGQISEYPIPTAYNSNPEGVALGPDGNLWFAEANAGNAIGKSTVNGSMTIYTSGLSSRAWPQGIAAGPDGNLWFTESGRTARIGRVTTSGTITEYSKGISSCGCNYNLYGIAAGPDGNMWFTETATNKIAQITTGGQVTEFSGLTANSGPEGITAGPKNTLWFTEGLGDAIGRVQLSDHLLYAFKSGSDGASPEAPLVAVGGMLYGTTENGGGATACAGGCGTIFQVAPSGSNYKVLYVFKGGNDGELPAAGLLYHGGMLYGTTTRGGGATLCNNGYGIGCGTIFRIAPSGSGYKILYSFKSFSTDGAIPFASLIASRAMLYGVTAYGGGSGNGGIGWGTVFKIAASGSGYKTLYSFQGDDTAPESAGIPQGSLVINSGMLYGTSVYSDGTCSCGTIFQIAPSGSDYRVLYTFKGGKDGSNPTSGLVADGGMLYGTTALGGGATACSGGCGTIFQIAPSGSAYSDARGQIARPTFGIAPAVRQKQRNPTLSDYKLLYALKGGKDGAFVQAGLAANSGTLYGTTLYGGGTGCTSSSTSSGCGTVFKLSETGGTEQVLGRFGGGSDGAFPYANLLVDGGMLYGTTLNGGGSTKCTIGCGTVFALTP